MSQVQILSARLESYTPDWDLRLRLSARNAVAVTMTADFSHDVGTMPSCDLSHNDTASEAGLEMKNPRGFMMFRMSDVPGHSLVV